MNREEAIDEKKKLLEGEDSPVLKRCISCYACNVFCPNDCRPYELITGRWHQRYCREGLPLKAEYLMPHKKPNFRSDLTKHMSNREKALLKKWQQTRPEGEVVLYPGCNYMALPHLLDASFMRGVPVAGSWDLCCGEMYFRMGLFDQVRLTAEGLSEYYRDKEIGTMLFSCPACMNMFKKVLPEQFGAEFNFKIEYLGSYLLGKIERGEIRPQKKINKTVAVHDSCHARVVGNEVMDAARQVLEETGVTIEEMALNREDGLCCGIAAGANSFSPLGIFSVAAKQLREGKKTGAEEIALYCGGCHLTLNLCSMFYPSRQQPRHILEYLQEACNEGDRSPVKRRSKIMLLNVLRKCLPRYFSFRRFWLHRDNCCDGRE